LEKSTSYEAPHYAVFSNLLSLETLIDASKEVGLKVNAEKPKYMSLSRHQNAEQNHYIKIANRCFENVAQLKYLETTVRNQNLIQREFKRKTEFR
jgi:hypothetical protein